MTAAPAVPSMQASGTSRFGFSTAFEFCAADSRPRNAHNVSEMLEPMPSPRLIPVGFQAAANVEPLNQIQPAMEMNPTGRMTPQTVSAPILPVSFGPPKLATVVSHSRAMTPAQVMTGVDVSTGANDDRYPSAELATATLAIASE